MTTLKTTLASLLLVILPEIFHAKDTELSENKKQSEIKNNLNNIERC